MRLDSAAAPAGSRLPVSARSTGLVRFAPAGQGGAAWADLRAQRFLCAGIPVLVQGGAAGAAGAAGVRPGGRPAARGGLRAAIDDAVELALALRGALPPRVDADAALGVVIEDQVFRALALGAAGIAVALPSLAPLAGAGGDGALDAADSAALAAWLGATREAPVALILAESDRQVRVLTPRPLAELVMDAAPPAESGELRTDPPPAEPPARLAVAAAEQVASDLADALGGAAIRGDIDLGERRAPELAVAAPASASAPPPAPAPAPAPMRLDMATAPTEPPPPVGPETRREGRPRGVLLPRSRTKRPDAAAVAAPVPEPEAAEPREDEERAPAPEAPRPADARPAPTRTRETRVTLRIPTEPAELPAVEPPPAPVEVALAPSARRAPRPPSRVVSAAEWRTLALELDEARGPKPVRVIEQLFMTHYMPLLGATLTGDADVTVHRVVETWRASFERSYRESFSALRVTGKRPPMVLDAPDIAARLARLNGARAVKLVLVDAMRFDLGERVAALLKDAIAGRAVLVERSLLWAALPTTTAAQLALLSRGPEGLREPPAVEQEPAIARGRAVTLLRRERAGRCELMKLDLVEARLRAQGPALPERLEGIAEEVTDVVARFMEGLPPRTLVMVLGDHGFRIGSMGEGPGTGPASQGGATPEEVLVPAQAWLVGGVH